MSRSVIGHQLANVSNGSTVSPIGVCPVCERECVLGQYVVYSRPTIGAQMPFFPILESLSGNCSQISCCRHCSQSLLNQWQEYESKQISIKNRFYYLNNKSIFNSKSDLTLNNKKHFNQNNSNISTDSPEEVLDLSLTSTSTPNSNSSSTQLRTNARNESNGNIKYWTPNRFPNVCYICGEESQTIVSVLVRPTANCPYFPSLVSHAKPLGANPMDTNGKIDSCESCHRFLVQQWDHFQRLNVPISERHYTLRPLMSNNETRNRVNRYSCALCNTEFSQSLQNVVISMLTINDSNSDLKKLILSSAQEFIVGSGVGLESGRVLTCINCFRDLIKNSDPTAQSAQPMQSQTHPSVHSFDTKKSITELNHSISEQQLCPLCNRVKCQSFPVQTSPSSERKPFFPFLKDLIKTQEIDSFGRVRVCNICLASLESQWEAFETALIPHTQRDYLIPSLRSPPDRSVSPPPLKIQVSSPLPIQQSFICEPLLTTVTTLTTQTHNTYATTSASKHYANKNETRISGPMDDMLSALGGPQLKSTNCVVCGEYSTAGHTFQMLSSPRIPPIISHELGIYPFFPFLKKLIAINASNNSEERDNENRLNGALVCTFCYHSLIGQWIAYNASPYIEDKDPMRRTYNCRDYICFICGVTTFRQRVRSIALKEFPFLLEHSRPSGALTLSDGENVVTCLTCFDSLTLQWKDYERMKVPIEMRKYNWITVAPPVRDTTLNEIPVSSAQNLIEGMSPSSAAKIMASHTSAANYHNVMSNSALAATRTSSFAAALRKLAKQSFDPLLSADSGQQCSSLALSVSHSSDMSKNSNSMSFQSSYHSTGMRPSPPIVTIAPIPAHQIDRNDGLRKGDNPSFFEHRLLSEQSKESMLFSHSQRTSPIVQVRPTPSRAHNDSLSSGGLHSTQSNVSNRSTGFQPYRGFEDSLRTNSSTSLTPTSLPSHLMPYDALTFPYNPFLPHSAPMTGSNPLSHHVPHPSASYRLADNYYLDRFSLLRGQLHGGPGLAPTGSDSTSSVPFNLVRYSELLNSQTERLINDERHRILNQSLSQSAFKASAQTIDSPPLRLNIGANNSERLIDSNSEQHLLNHSSIGNSSAINHLNSGSIMSGTPREVVVGSGGLQNSHRSKQSGLNISAVKPLNLSSNCEQHVNSGSEQTFLWRPQSDGQKDSHSLNQIRSEQQLNSYINQRKNNNFVVSEDNCEDNRSTDRVIANSKLLSLERNNSSEGLHSRILENSEKSIGNDLTVKQIKVENVVQKSPKSVRKESNEKIVSKLDLEEIKLKQKRENMCFENEFSSDEDLDQSDSEDNDENRFKYSIILTKRLPLELDTNAEKMQFLEVFNLTSHKRKSQIEFNKYIKRRKILRQLSPEPDPEVDDNNTIVSVNDNHKQNPDVLTESHIIPDSIAGEEQNLEVKVHFMSTIGLCEQNSNDMKRNVELLWNGITNERQMRTKRQNCWTKVLNNLSEDTLHKWLNSLQSNGSHSSTFVSDIETRIHSNGFIQNCITNGKSINNYFNHNSSRSQRKVILFNKQMNDSKSSSLSMDNRSHNHSIHSTKDFAQEFHESVLLETTKQQQSRQSTTNEHQCRPMDAIRHSADNYTYSSSSSTSSYNWPGIEAVMEAYDRYSYDRNQEKDFLYERSLQLKNREQDIKREEEYLSQKLTNLMQTKTLLDEERQQFEDTLDDLKTCLRQLR